MTYFEELEELYEFTKIIGTDYALPIEPRQCTIAKRNADVRTEREIARVLRGHAMPNRKGRWCGSR
jgi:hypothetical protein